MHWEWVVPVIALLLWILNGLLRNTEEQPRNKRQRPGAGDAEPRPRPTSDVDKFLEEINRMRRQAVEQPRAEAPAPPIPEVIPVDQPGADFEKPKALPAVAAVARPEKAKPRPVRPRRVEAPRSGSFPQPAPLPQPVPPVQAAPLVAADAPLLQKPSVPRSTPAVTQVWSLLKTPANVQAAILLREVLGPPRCRRRR